jgi:hypothetical protein
MKRGAGCLVALVLLMVGSVGLGQATAPGSGEVSTAPIDIYANFVGTWVGTHRFWEDGAERTEPAKIEITEEKEKQRLRLLYVFGQLWARDLNDAVLFITLDPSKGEMTSYFSRHSALPHKPQHAVGLGDFTKTGYGNFTTTDEEVSPDGHRTVSRTTYVLDADVFGYVMSQSVDGKPFATFSVFKLRREPVSGAEGPTQ